MFDTYSKLILNQQFQNQDKVDIFQGQCFLYNFKHVYERCSSAFIVGFEHGFASWAANIYFSKSKIETLEEGVKYMLMTSFWCFYC